MEQLLFQHAPLGDIEHRPENLACAALFLGREHALVKKIPIVPVGALPAVFTSIRSGFKSRFKFLVDALNVLGVDSARAERGVAGEVFRRKAREPLDVVADEKYWERRLDASRRDHDRDRWQDLFLPLLSPTQRPLRLELLVSNSQVLDEEPALLLALAADFLGLAGEIDEDVHLRFENQRLDGLEDVIHGSRRIAAENVQFVLVV